MLAGRANLAGFFAACFFAAAGFFEQVFFAAVFFGAAPFLQCFDAFSASEVASSSKSARERFLLMFEPKLVVEPGEGGVMEDLRMAAGVEPEFLAVCVYQAPGGAGNGEMGEDRGEESIRGLHMVGVVDCACLVDGIEVGRATAIVDPSQVGEVEISMPSVASAVLVLDTFKVEVVLQVVAGCEATGAMLDKGALRAEAF